MNSSSSMLANLRSFNRPARLFLFATVIDGVVYSAWSLFFNFYILELGFGRDFLGLANAMPSIAMLLLGLPLGLLSDRIGRKRAMVIGVAVYMVAMALQVTVRSPLLLLAAAFLGGASSCFYYLSQAPFMMKVSTPENRTLLFSVNYGFVTLAGTLGNLFAGQLPALFGGWLQVDPGSAQAYQAVLLASVALGTLALVPLLMIREEAPAQPGMQPSPPDALQEAQPEASSRELTAETAAPSLLGVLTQRITWKVSLPNLCIGFGAAILIPYMNVFLRERFSMNDETLGLIFSLSSLLTGVGTIIGPRLAMNLGGKIRAVVLTQGLSLAFLLLLGFSPYAGLASIAFLMRNVLMNMAAPLYSAFAMEQVPENQQGSFNSVKELSWQSGWAVGPYLSGLIQAAAGFTPLFVLTAILYGLSIGFTWLFFRHSEKAPKKAEVAPA